MTQELNTKFSSYQKVVMLILALLQFAIILDFMIIAPIGDALMKTLDIGTKEFGVVVSSYAFSAAISGILVAGLTDKYDLKKVLLFFFFGFIVGTLFCALSSTYIEILLSRIITGIFAGITSSAVLTIVTDIYAPQMRGRAMSGVQMGFAASQILGVPLGIFIANKLGWNSTFTFIVVFSILLLITIFVVMKPITGHLQHQSDKNAFLHLWHTLTNKQYQIGFMAVTFLTIGGFMLMPFSAVFLINNVHITAEQLPIVFLCTGLSSLIVMPVIGKLCDQFDRYKIFMIGSLAASVMVFIYTHLSTTPLWLVITINMLLFAGIMSRMSPAMALNTMVPKPEDRGAYMSISASLQQTAGGISSVIAGFIVFQASETSPLEHFDILGYASITVFIVCIFLVRRVSISLKQRTA
jgi:predicted MFS family arabinose efflux permease